MEEAKGYSGWAILELFGRQMLAGSISEEVIAGTAMLRIDVPAVDGIPGWTKYFGGAAIYSLTPTTEDMVMLAGKRLQPRPVDPWVVSVPQLGRYVEHEEGE